MEVILSSPRGFCAGVVRSIEVVDICLRRFGAPVYVKHQIVHNPHVVADLERKGAITVETIEEIPPGSLVVFSAHGSPPEDFEKAKERNLKVIDAVCPLVTRVHNEAKKYHREELWSPPGGCPADVPAAALANHTSDLSGHRLLIVEGRWNLIGIFENRTGLDWEAYKEAVIGEKRLIVTAPYKVDHDAALKSRLSGRALSEFVFRIKVYE